MHHAWAVCLVNPLSGSTLHLMSRIIDILYTLGRASNYYAIQKLKPLLQTQDIPMKSEDSYVFYFLNTERKPIPNTFLNYSNDESYCCF